MRTHPPAPAAIFVSAIAASQATWANRYVVIDLGREVWPHQISDGGTLAGTNGRKSHACGMRWRNGRWQRLDGALDALAVNSRGDVAGYSDEGAFPNWPTVWPSRGQPFQLRLQQGGGSYGQATAIADDGSFAGWVRGSGFACFHADPDGDGVDMQFPGSTCYVSGMNNHGQIAGYGTFSDVGENGFVWQDGTFTKIGALSGRQYSVAYAVNDRGEVVGESDSTGYDSVAYLWKDGAMTALPAPKSYVWSAAMAINDQGVIVGYGSQDGSHNLALRFVVGGKAVDLNSETENLEDWNLVDADSVNREGVIAGIGYRADGDYHTFVLVPKP